MGDVAVEGVDFSALAALHILASGGERVRHLAGDFESPGQGCLGIFQAGGLNVRGFGYGPNFVDNGFNDFAGVLAGDDLSIARVAERGNSVKRAVPHELGPELSLNIIGDAAGDAGLFKECGNTLGARVARADHEITATNVLDLSGFGDRCRDVDDRAEPI